VDERGVHHDIAIPAGADGSSGVWTLRINHTTGNANATLQDVYLCQIDSGCSNKATLGSTTGLGFTTDGGIATVTITQQSAVTLAGGDRVMMVAVYNSPHSHGNVSFGVTPDQVINSPWDDGVSPGTSYDGYQQSAMSGYGS
jgi:hypothetical protein